MDRLLHDKILSNLEAICNIDDLLPSSIYGILIKTATAILRIAKKHIKATLNSFILINTVVHKDQYKVGIKFPRTWYSPAYMHGWHCSSYLKPLERLMRICINWVAIVGFSIALDWEIAQFAQKTGVAKRIFFRLNVSNWLLLNKVNQLSNNRIKATWYKENETIKEP